MKKHLVIFAFLISLLTLFHPLLKSETVYQIDFASRYIWRGFDLNPHKKPVIQPSIEFTFGRSGFSLELWSSLSFVSKELNEFDLILSYSTDLSKDFSLSAGLVHYGWYLAENFRFSDDTSHEVFLSLESPGIFLNPTLSVFYDFTSGDGIYLLLEIGHSFTLSDWLGADLFASLGYNGGQWLAEKSDSGLSDLNFGLSLPVQLGSFQVAAFANYTIVLLEAIGEENFFWFGVSVSYSGKGERK